MVKHIVTFKFRGFPEQRMDVARRFKDALLALPDKIDVLKGIEVGINENPDEEWDLVLVAKLEKMADIPVYSNHPAHVEAVKIIADLKDQRACVDFYC